jgi:hypothetical protein
MRVQGRKQGREIGGGKIALAFFFVIAIDSLSRIVSAHLLATREGQHFRQERGEAIGAVRGAFAHYPMQVGNVGMTFKLPGFRFQGLISTGVSIAINFGRTTAHIRKFDRGRLRLYRVGAKARPATFSHYEPAAIRIAFIFPEAEVFPKNFLY